MFVLIFSVQFVSISRADLACPKCLIDLFGERKGHNHKKLVVVVVQVVVASICRPIQLKGPLSCFEYKKAKFFLSFFLSFKKGFSYYLFTYSAKSR